MPSFRSAQAQAKHAISQISAIGKPRHGSRDGKIHSLGTSRNYQQSIKLFAKWLGDAHRSDLRTAGREEIMEYLADVRAGEVGQKQLDMDRQAIQAIYGERLPVIRSELETVVRSRAYTREQLDLVMASQGQRNALATEIAAAAGLRAHELLTLLPVAERPASGHREWSRDRFTGREGNIYTVCGKGGLIREIMIPKELAERLETTRLESPVTVKDRGCYIQKAYNLGGGKSWTSSFSAASQRALGWSQGGHGCRHTYAQERMHEMERLSYSVSTSILAQELGHFRNEAKLIGVYLR